MTQFLLLLFLFHAYLLPLEALEHVTDPVSKLLGVGGLSLDSHILCKSPV